MAAYERQSTAGLVEGAPKTAVITAIALSLVLGSLCLGRSTDHGGKPVGALRDALSGTSRTSSPPAGPDVWPDSPDDATDASEPSANTRLSRRNVAIWGGEGDEWLSVVAVAPDGSVYAAGHDGSSAMLMRLSGDLALQRVMVRERCSILDVAVAPSGSVYAVLADYGGETRIARLSPGLVEQDSITCAPGTSCSAIAVTSDGSVYAAGYQLLLGYHATIRRYSPGLDELACASVDKPNDARFTALSIAPDGTVYAAGNEFIQGDRLDSDPFVIRYDPNLLELDSASLSREDGFISAIAVAPDGSVYAAGRSSAQSDDHAGMILEFSPGLLMRGNTRHQCEADCEFDAIAVTPEGLVYAAGHSSTHHRDRTAFVEVYGAGLAGQLGHEWQDGGFRSIGIAPDGSIYAAGRTYGTDGRDDASDTLLIRYTP